MLISLPDGTQTIMCILPEDVAREKAWKCSICCHVFASQLELQTHFRQHNAGGFPTWKCSSCGKKYVLRSGLEAHMAGGCGGRGRYSRMSWAGGDSRLHSRTRMFLCSFCGKSFHYKPVMQRHERLHAGEKPVVDMPHLSSHQNAEHSGGSPYVCTRCRLGPSLDRRSDLHTGQGHVKPLSQPPSSSSPPTHELPPSESWQCFTCCEWFPDSDKLRVHLQRHESEAAQTLAHKRFGEEFKFQKCLKLHSGIQRMCGVRDLTSHSALLPEWETVSRSLSSNSFFNKLSVQKHQRLGKEQKPFVCGVCNTAFAVRQHLVTHHGALHPDVSLYGCKHCGFLTTNEAHLRLHQETFHDKCKSGGTATEQPTRQGREVIPSAGAPLSPSGVISDKSPSGAPLTNGVASSDERAHAMEEEEESLQCSTCLLGFSSQSRLQDHIQQHQPTVTETFPCNLCGKEFSCIKYLKLHIESHSEADSQLVSSDCGRAFAEHSDLKLQRSDLHSGEKMFACSICRKRFRHKFAMRRHKMLHGHERTVEHGVYRAHRHVGYRKVVYLDTNNLHGCKFCGLKFFDKSDLRAHEETCLPEGNEVNPNGKYEQSTLREQNVDASAVSASPCPESSNDILLSEEPPFGTDMCNDPSSGAFEFHEPASVVHPLTETCCSSSSETDKETPFKCDICKDEFSSEEILATHLEQHDSNSTAPFECNLCGKEFIAEERLRVHTETLCGREPRHMCRVCGIVFQSRHKLAAHSVLHSGEKVFVCSFCDKIFRHRFAMQRHERTHLGIKPFVCEVCNKPFALRQHLVGHLKAVHPENSPYICEHCGLAFSSERNLRLHSILHTEEKIFSCSFCWKSFRHRFAWRRHERSHLGEKPFVCEVCNKPFALRHHLVGHYNAVHSEKKLYFCEYCGLTFFYKRNFNRHRNAPDGTCGGGTIENSKRLLLRKEKSAGSSSGTTPDTGSAEQEVFAREMSFVCPTCQCTFATKGKLQAHLRTHKSKVPEVFTCNLCGKVLKFKGTLKTHIESHCVTEPQHRCRECGKAFKTRGNLALHSVLHSEERSFLCPYCKKSFRHKSAMRRHEKSHKGDRPFVCKVCNKTFALRHHLVGHHKAQHPDESLNTCELCGMSFSYKRELNQHRMANGGKCGEDNALSKDTSSCSVIIKREIDIS